MKTLILHGWGGSDYPHWQSYLASSIAGDYGTVSFPLLHNCHFPSKNRWVKDVKAILEEFKPDRVVCHSLANTLWFWLCKEDIAPIKKLYMVSPPSLSCDIEILKSFFPVEMPSTLKADSIEMVVSDDDPYITLNEAREIALYYGIEPTIIANGRHINADSGYGRWEWIEQRLQRRGDDT